MESNFCEAGRREYRKLLNDQRLCRFARGERIERDDAENELPGQNIYNQ
jgi:hypothetical protein